MKELLSTLGSGNFLLTSILADIDNTVYLAALRALGIVNKLVKGPIYRKIEEKGHIFELNKIWMELKALLERCSKDASELMDG